MKQLSKLESAIFLLGGVLMVVGAACFAFGFSHPQLVQVTSRHLLRALGHLDGRYSVCFPAPLV